LIRPFIRCILHNSLTASSGMRGKNECSLLPRSQAKRNNQHSLAVSESRENKYPFAKPPVDRRQLPSPKSHFLGFEACVDRQEFALVTALVGLTSVGTCNRQAVLSVSGPPALFFIRKLRNYPKVSGFSPQSPSSRTAWSRPHRRFHICVVPVWADVSQYEQRSLPPWW
jgi:hypothetical protein